MTEHRHETAGMESPLRNRNSKPLRPPLNPSNPETISPWTARRSEILDLAIAVFEETDEKRAVLRDCKVCLRHAEVYGSGVLSPSGVAHIAEYEDTLCGKDATRDGWWWPS